MSGCVYTIFVIISKIEIKCIHISIDWLIYSFEMRVDFLVVNLKLQIPK